MACNITSPKSLLEEVLQCKLCSNQLKEPHCLTKCLHSFCKSCLEAIPVTEKQGRNGWLCPECDNFTNRDDVIENEFIVNLIQVLNTQIDCKSEKTCKQCCKKDKEASGWCTDCKMVLCADCQFGHLQIPLIKHHTIEKLDIQVKAMYIDKLTCCRKHQNRPVEYNCKDCETMFCFQCNLSEHNNHTAESIEQALDRLQPKLQDDTAMIKMNINNLEAQIQAVNRKIEDTKYVYAACRIDMDERLKKLINRVKAAKAEMEDEVTAQETRVLNILGNIKRQLEQKVNEAKNLVNLVAITAENVKHTSLLGEIQKFLYPAIEEFSQKRPDQIEIQIDIPTFVEYQDDTEELKQTIGYLDYNKPLNSINTCGKIWTENPYIFDDLNAFFETDFEKVTEVAVIVKWCNRLAYINKHLMMCLNSMNEIRVFDNSGKCVSTLQGDKRIKVLKKAYNGDIIAAGGKGLYVTNDECTVWNKLSDGSFSDICIHENKFLVLEYPLGRVITYALKNKPSSRREFNWSVISSFTVDRTEDPEVKINGNCTLLINCNGNIIVCLMNSNTIHLYSPEGNMLHSYCTKNWLPTLCGIDQSGCMLISNFYGNKLYKTNNLEDITVKNLEKLEIKIDCKQTRDVVIDNDSSLWLLQGDSDYYQLVKYVNPGI